MVPEACPLINHNTGRRSLRATEAVLLDFDGTLIDSNYQHALAWRHYLVQKTGLDLPVSRLGAMIGMGGDKILTELFGTDAYSDKEMQKMGKERDELYMEQYWHRVQPIAGAEEFVRALYTKGYKVVLATSMSDALLEEAYRTTRVKPFILGATTADDTDESKPAPDIFSAAMKKYRVYPHRTVVVGDSPYDIAAGEKALCRATVAVRTGNFPDQMLSRATAIYDSVYQLMHEIESSPLGR